MLFTEKGAKRAQTRQRQTTKTRDRCTEGDGRTDEQLRQARDRKQKSRESLGYVMIGARKAERGLASTTSR